MSAPEFSRHPLTWCWWVRLCQATQSYMCYTCMCVSSGSFKFMLYINCTYFHQCKVQTPEQYQPRPRVESTRRQRIQGLQAPFSSCPPLTRNRSPAWTRQVASGGWSTYNVCGAEVLFADMLVCSSRVCARAPTLLKLYRSWHSFKLREPRDSLFCLSLDELGFVSCYLKNPLWFLYTEPGVQRDAC